MSKYCPVYPKPLKNNAWGWLRWLKRDSLLGKLTERTYSMHMGESHVAGHTVYAANDPAVVRRVLVEKHAQYPKHRYMADLLGPLVGGQSIFTSNGEAWSRQRKLMEPAFEQTRMEVAFPAMREAVEAMLSRLAELPDGGTAELEAEMTHVTADVIFRTIFTTPLSGAAAERAYKAFATFQRKAPPATMPRYRPQWLKPIVQAWQARKSAQAIRQQLHELIAPRYAAFHAGQPGPQQDILASMLAAREEGTGRMFTEEELVNEIAVLFLAGHETSASALAWALHLLARDPEIQARMHAEIREVLGDEPATPEHLRRLDLTRRVFRETLRLYPPLSFLVREATAPDCLRDKQVAPGSTVLISPWLIHHHRLYWERPDEFDPDRYLTEAGKASAASAYLPFSIGPRVCVGAGFALQEAALVLAMVIRRYRVEAPAGENPIPEAHLSLRSDRGIRLRLWRR